MKNNLGKIGENEKQIRKEISKSNLGKDVGKES